ncbi:MAG TPA: vWA domain-containing protein [Gemmataceae bacterium]|jgi:Mg-chelatase subunit ChlD|nr:vWA domain-containing protein [Gemmataceae bacterium]
MKLLRVAILAACVVSCPVDRSSAAPAERKDPKPQVEVVFCLDTTGSMGGLIEGAKQKIWSIVNQIASGRPAPDVKVGLVAYRDKGDAYITKVFDLTLDLDDVHKNLKSFKAEGGGDTPESVNQGLNEAVTRIKWSKDKDTLRIVFLVGDAPPHMDYPDDVKYPETCKLASSQGIIINTVLCGNDGEAKKHWMEICAKAGGSFAQIAQDGGVKPVDTPYDKELADLNGKLLQTNVCYGEAKDRKAGVEKNLAAGALPGAGGVAADSAGFRAKASRLAANDLLDDLKEGKLKLNEVKEEQLPDDMKKMKPEERKAHVEKLQKDREELKKKALDLDKKRLEFIAKKQAEEKEKGKVDGFDSQILDTLRKQAEKVNIKY